MTTPDEAVNLEAAVERLEVVATDLLVDRFAIALKEKLRAAQEKYGWDDGWLSANWQADCIEQLHAHVEKGDPRDVAAYCAFAWHHGWPTAQKTEGPRLTGQLDAIAAAIGAVEFMDPPDGGDVPLAEQVRRMKAAYDASNARAVAAEEAAYSEAFIEAVAREMVRDREGPSAWATYNDALRRYWIIRATNMIGRARTTLASMKEKDRG